MNITKRTVNDRWNNLYSWLPIGSTIYIAQSQFSEKDQVKQAGFRWQPEFKVWWTNDINRAAKLSEYADPSCQEELDVVRKKNFESIQDSHASNTDISFPHPENLDYYPFQKAGIKYAISREGTLIGDDMGLGKTIQAIGLINALPEIKTVLIIVPASLKTNWDRECKRWLVRPMKIAIADGQICPMPENGYNIIIINYDVVKRHDCLRSITWDLIILDEVHRYKNYKALRTIAIYGDKDNPGIKAKRRLALTGTPICNRPMELYPTLAYLNPEWKTKWRYFMSRYCDYNRTKFGCDVSGAKNLDELQEVLRREVMIRRLKSQVLTELPSKTRQIVYLEADGSARKAVQCELSEAQKSNGIYEKLKTSVELSKALGEEQYKAAVEALKNAMSVEFAQLSRLRHETALAKVPAAIEYIKERFEEVKKIVVFAHHADVIDKICEAFSGISVHLTGSDKLEDRQKSVDSFQNDPKIRVFVGSITAAGVGITLTAASLVLFIELDWVPGNVTQAEDRCHRIGQKDSVTIQHLLFDESIDCKMAKTLIEKQEIIDKTLDLSPEEPVHHSDQPSTSSISRREIERLALNITKEEIQEIHAKLRILASYDTDYASSQNGMGFNKIDTEIGHSLAEQTTLTAKQAVLGGKLLKKYYKQLSK